MPSDAGSITKHLRIEHALLRGFAGKIELLSADERHLRYVPAALAQSMAAAGTAQVHNANGRVKSIRLVTTAASHAHLIGPPDDGASRGVRFSVREKLDCGGIVWKHHPRCRDYEN